MKIKILCAILLLLGVTELPAMKRSERQPAAKRGRNDFSEETHACAFKVEKQATSHEIQFEGQRYCFEKTPFGIVCTHGSEVVELNHSSGLNPAYISINNKGNICYAGTTVKKWWSLEGHLLKEQSARVIAPVPVHARRIVMPTSDNLADIDLLCLGESFYKGHSVRSSNDDSEAQDAQSSLVNLNSILNGLSCLSVNEDLIERSMRSQPSDRMVLELEQQSAMHANERDVHSAPK